MELKHKYEERERLVTPGQYDLEFYREYNFEESKCFKINHYPSEHKPDYFRRIYKDKEFLSPVKYEHVSRYETISTMKELGKQYHVTNRIRGVKYCDEDIYYIVDNNTENRLDKISLMHYDTPIYWWIIAHANNIFDAFDIPRGTRLRIPPLSSIYGYYTK